MGWRPWELEQIEHPRDFIEAVHGFQWRMRWELDRAAFIAYHVLTAGGVKKNVGPGLEGEPIGVDEILGRPLFDDPLVPTPELSPSELEEREMEEAERFAKVERAKLEIWAAKRKREAEMRGEEFGIIG